MKSLDIAGGSHLEWADRVKFLILVAILLLMLVISVTH